MDDEPDVNFGRFEFKPRTLARMLAVESYGDESIERDRDEGFDAGRQFQSELFHG